MVCIIATSGKLHDFCADRVIGNHSRVGLPALANWDDYELNWRCGVFPLGILMNDFYEVLQVSPGAEPEVIEAAYKRLATKYHPDRNLSPDAHTRMWQINQAYEILRDPTRRSEYDLVRLQARQSQNGPTTQPLRQSAPPISNPPINRNWIKLIAGIAAVVILTIYLPWLLLIPVGWFALTRVRKWLRKPGVGSGVIQLLASVAGLVLIGSFVLWHGGTTQRDKRTRAYAAADLAGILQASIENDILPTCLQSSVPKVGTVVAKEFCDCVARTTSNHFDNSPIEAESESEFKSEFAARLGAAIPKPDSEAIAECTALIAQPPQQVAPVVTPKKLTNAELLQVLEGANGNAQPGSSPVPGKGKATNSAKLRKSESTELLKAMRESTQE